MLEIVLKRLDSSEVPIKVDERKRRNDHLNTYQLRSSYRAPSSNFSEHDRGVPVVDENRSKRRKISKQNVVTNGLGEDTTWSNALVNESYSEFPTKKELSRMNVHLVKAMNDFQTFLHNMMENYRNLEEKYLNSSKDSDDSNSSVKHEFLRLILDTRDGAMVLEKDFLNCLKNFEKHSKSTVYAKNFTIDDEFSSISFEEKQIKREILASPAEEGEKESESIADVSEERPYLSPSTCYNVSSLQSDQSVVTYYNTLENKTHLRLLLDAERSVTTLKNYYLNNLRRSKDDEITRECPGSEKINGEVKNDSERDRNLTQFLWAEEIDEPGVSRNEPSQSCGTGPKKGRMMNGDKKQSQRISSTISRQTPHQDSFSSRSNDVVGEMDGDESVVLRKGSKRSKSSQFESSNDSENSRVADMNGANKIEISNDFIGGNEKCDEEVELGFESSKDCENLCFYDEKVDNEVDGFESSNDRENSPIADVNTTKIEMSKDSVGKDEKANEEVEDEHLNSEPTHMGEETMLQIFKSLESDFRARKNRDRARRFSESMMESIFNVNDSDDGSRRRTKMTSKVCAKYDKKNAKRWSLSSNKGWKETRMKFKVEKSDPYEFDDTSFEVESADKPEKMEVDFESLFKSIENSPSCAADCDEKILKRNKRKSRKRKVAPLRKNYVNRILEKARKKYDQKEKVKLPYEEWSIELNPNDASTEKEVEDSNSSFDSYSSVDDCSSDISGRTKKRFHRVRLSDEKKEKQDKSQNPTKGRKNIREIMSEQELGEQTRVISREEEARKSRIKERQVVLDEAIKVGGTPNQSVEEIVLDYDPETNEKLVTVHPKLAEKLKPHQVLGVKFMWNATFESLKQIADGNKGGGCILGHCMGLGKTLQVITLVHTILSHPEPKVKRILVICPLTVILNWRAEFDKWLEDVDNKDEINVYDLTKHKHCVAINELRADNLRHWFTKGGVMILNYQLFRSLVELRNSPKCQVEEIHIEQIESALLSPGPDLVVCDEGHSLKNEKSGISKAMMRIGTSRRIVLTGTPFQNNLNEYHCMVQFVKPNVLGNRREFQNRFVNPITNGQYKDSSPWDVQLMKNQAHVLHRKLEGFVQRLDFSTLIPYLEPKYEFVISVSLSDLQIRLYKLYLENKGSVTDLGRTVRLFSTFEKLRLLWNHPLAMKFGADKKKDEKRKEESQSIADAGKYENVDISKTTRVDEGKNENADISKTAIVDAEKDENTDILKAASANTEGDENKAILKPDSLWWYNFVAEGDLEALENGPKMMLLFAILELCERMGEKLLVFSSSIPTLNTIEYFLEKRNELSIQVPLNKSNKYAGRWKKNHDYLRIDGGTPNELRAEYCNRFNRPGNSRARLFLISTKVGGLGINLTAANRVIIFDVSWNPSLDSQSIFRVYRLGQMKPCYIYRFVSQGTMEEKMYERQVTKLSVSCRVVDEQQIARHYFQKDIHELYKFEPKPAAEKRPKLPNDHIMAKLLLTHLNFIVDYHEHDSLLENVQNEKLTEEEQLVAWIKYENENINGRRSLAQEKVMSQNDEKENGRNDEQAKISNKNNEELTTENCSVLSANDEKNGRKCVEDRSSRSTLGGSKKGTVFADQTNMNPVTLKKTSPVESHSDNANTHTGKDVCACLMCYNKSKASLNQEQSNLFNQRIDPSHQDQLSKIDQPKEN